MIVYLSAGRMPSASNRRYFRDIRSGIPAMAISAKMLKKKPMTNQIRSL